MRENVTIFFGHLHEKYNKFLHISFFRYICDDIGEFSNLNQTH